MQVQTKGYLKQIVARSISFLRAAKEEGSKVAKSRHSPMSDTARGVLNYYIDLETRNKIRESQRQSVEDLNTPNEVINYSDVTQSVRRDKDLERLFIHHFLFEKNTKWRDKMEKTIDMAVANIGEFRSGSTLIEYLQSEYHEFFMRGRSELRGKLMYILWQHSDKNKLANLIARIEKTNPARASVIVEDMEHDICKFARGLPRNRFRYLQGGNYTPLSVHYSYRDKAKQLVDMSQEYVEIKQETSPLTDLASDFNKLFGYDASSRVMFKGKAHVMRETINGEIIELTKTILVEENNQNPKLNGSLVWVHTDQKHISKIKRHIDKLYDEVVALREKMYLGEIPRDQENLESITKRIAEIHWWSVQGYIQSRGSAGISDMFSKAVFDSFGIKASRYKDNTDPTQEALTKTRNDFIETYKDLFNEALEWVNLNSDIAGSSVAQQDS